MHPVHAEIDRFLTGPVPSPTDLAGSIAAVEAEIDALSEQWHRLERTVANDPARSADPNRLHDPALLVLRQQLAAAEAQLLQQWAALLIAHRRAGGRVELTAAMQVGHSPALADRSPIDLVAQHSPQPGATRQGASVATSLDRPWPDAALLQRTQDLTQRIHAGMGPLPSVAAAKSTPSGLHLQSGSHQQIGPLQSQPGPISTTDLETLQARLRGDSCVTEPVRANVRLPVRAWQELALELTAEPPTEMNEDSLREELMRLQRAVRPDRMAQWKQLPAELACAVVGNLVARARAAQAEELRPLLRRLDPDLELDGVFSRLTAWQREVQPGFVHGLGRHHLPRGANWREDALVQAQRIATVADEHYPPAGRNRERALTQLGVVQTQEGIDDSALLEALSVAVESGVAQDDPRLVRMMRPRLELLGRHAKFKVLRKAIRSDIEAETSVDTVVEPTHSLPADWPWWHLVRGRRAAMVGGDPREEPRSRIENHFGLASLDWRDLDQVRHLESLASRIRSGGIDLVILLQSLLSHDASDSIVEACQTANVPFVAVERGYGVERIRMAIERHLARMRAA